MVESVLEVSACNSKAEEAEKQGSMILENKETSRFLGGKVH